MTVTLPYPDMSFTPLDTLTADEMNQMAANDKALAESTVAKKLMPTFVRLTGEGETGSTEPSFSITTNTGSVITGLWVNNGTGCALRGGCDKVVMVKGDVYTNTTIENTVQMTRTALQPVKGSSNVYYSVPYFENQAAPTWARQAVASSPSSTASSYCPAGTSYSNPSTDLNTIWLHYCSIYRGLAGNDPIWLHIIDKVADGVEVKERVIARSTAQDHGGVPTPYCQYVSQKSWTAVAMLEIWEEAD